ncbi:MAG: agmatine deiminase family protein [Fimbriimonas sp.]|nr:agmatine deiminase family protein [Fimbriimonas sp.]
MLTALFVSTLLKAELPQQAAAEFAPQRAVWMAWPTYDHKKGLSIAMTTNEIVRELTKNVKVEMLVPDQKTLKSVRKLLPTNRLSLRVADYSEIWMRDFGPYFITNGKQKTILDFGFNFWGYEKTSAPSSVQHEKIDRFLSKKLGVPTRASGTIGEGGDREANGDGVAMFVKEVEMQRNPTLSFAEVDQKLKSAMGVQKIIWLESGVIEDGLFFKGPLKLPEGDIYMPATTGGHLDNIARFVDANTIVAAEVTEAEAKKSDLARRNRERMEANYSVLRAARDIHGRPFTIHRMPVPDLHIETLKPGDPVYDFMADVDYRPAHKFPKGKSIKVAHAASYLNFLITNGVVLTSKLYRSGAPIALKRKDRETVVQLKKLFPKHRVVAIETRSLNLGGGGIHCITSHEPL